jgi:hypothetical protein
MKDLKTLWKAQEFANTFDRSYADLEEEYHNVLISDAERALARLPDGLAMRMQNSYGKILSILSLYVGEARNDEGAVEVLKRLLIEVHKYRDLPKVPPTMKVK